MLTSAAPSERTGDEADILDPVFGDDDDSLRCPRILSTWLDPHPLPMLASARLDTPLVKTAPSASVWDSVPVCVPATTCILTPGCHSVCCHLAPERRLKPAGTLDRSSAKRRGLDPVAASLLLARLESDSEIPADCLSTASHDVIKDPASPAPHEITIAPLLVMERISWSSEDVSLA